MPIFFSTLNSHTVLNLSEDEVVLQYSTVEKRSIRRRASRLLPNIAGSQIKPKTRDLVLTNHRLFCLKQRSRTPDGLTVKAELLLRNEANASRDKEKESRSVIASAELKGEREFVILSVSFKSYVLLVLVHTFSYSLRRIQPMLLQTPR